MVSAEAADGVDDPVFLSKGLAVHSLVEVLNVPLDLVIVHAVSLDISVVAHLQNAEQIELLNSNLGPYLLISHSCIHYRDGGR